HTIPRATEAAAAAVNGRPKSRGTERAVTRWCWSRSANASMAVTAYPARAADSAAARVETPHSSRRSEANPRPRPLGRDDEQPVEHRAGRLAEAEHLDERGGLTAAQAVCQQRRALRGLLGHGRKAGEDLN